MSNLTAIDADGHVIERESEIRKYLKEPWNRRSTALRPGDQPWDNYMFDHLSRSRPGVSSRAVSRSRAGTISWTNIRSRPPSVFRRVQGAWSGCRS